MISDSVYGCVCSSMNLLYGSDYLQLDFREMYWPFIELIYKITTAFAYFIFFIRNHNTCNLIFRLQQAKTLLTNLKLERNFLSMLPWDNRHDWRGYPLTHFPLCYYILKFCIPTEKTWTWQGRERRNCFTQLLGASSYVPWNNTGRRRFNSCRSVPNWRRYFLRSVAKVRITFSFLLHFFFFFSLLFYVCPFIYFIIPLLLPPFPLHFSFILFILKS